ncbi:MAG: Holliday junction resolvase RecU [Alicyclobacillus sp.]|nr:Holliday junction resolvase RecU [Alicyclobacillus sp.]
MRNHGGRGQALETLINYTNECYMRRNMAVITKRPTPVKIVRTQGTKILSAYLEAKSTVDYEGVYRGRSLQFEAKSTRESSSFPLKNFHEHQVEHMRACAKQGAIVFAVVEFTKDDERLWVPAKVIIDAWDKHKAGGPASIPRDDLEIQCWRIPSARGVPCDYLQIVDKILDKAVG